MKAVSIDDPSGLLAACPCITLKCYIVNLFFFGGGDKMLACLMSKLSCCIIIMRRDINHLECCTAWRPHLALLCTGYKIVFYVVFMFM